MFPGTYVPRYLCNYVPRYLCYPNLCSGKSESTVPMFPGTYVPRFAVGAYLVGPTPPLD